MKHEKFKPHLITEVMPNSIAEEMELESGDYLLAINNQRIEDVFDYRFLLSDEQVDLLVRKANGEEWEIEVEKDIQEDLGLVFETELMDELIRCTNKCKFCFIDQLPQHMRETVYFKDDDWRTSFLNGSYITLTNMREEDFERLIRYKLSPINISIHATDPEVRKNLLTNRFAGKIMEQLERLVAGGIEINGQIVLCRGYNDGEVLERTIKDLSQYIPHILSLTIVPVGLSKYREDLTFLKPFDKESATTVIEVVEKWQKYYLERMGTRFVFCADEFFVVSGKPLPDYDSYEGFPVLDNGVGMLTKFQYELEEALLEVEGSAKEWSATLVTGKITEAYMKGCVQKVQEKFPNFKLEVCGIENHFFGKEITVTGLLTGQDIIAQLKQKKDLGRVVVIVENMLKYDEHIFLDNYHIKDLEEALQTSVLVVENEGHAWLEALLEAGLEVKEKNKNE